MKLNVVAVVFLFMITGCTKPVSENEKVATLMFQYFNQHEWKKMAEMYAENAQFLDPSFGSEYVSQTREQTASKYAEMEKMFPDLHDEIVGMYSSGDKVIVEFVATGSSGDSIKFKLPIAAILTIQDGKIVKDATYYDNQ